MYIVRKYYIQLTVTAKVGLINNNPTTANNNDDNNKGPNKDIIGNIRAYYIQIFSQRSPKKEWDNIYNFIIKNRLPREGLKIIIQEMANRKKNKKSIYNFKP